MSCTLYLGVFVGLCHSAACAAFERVCLTVPVLPLESGLVFPTAVFAAAWRVFHTAACAALRTCLSHTKPVLQPELPLNVSVQQQPILPLDISTLQKPVLPLDIYVQQTVLPGRIFPTAACAASERVAA